MLARDSKFRIDGQACAITSLTDIEVGAVSGGLSSNGWTTYGNMLLGFAGIATAIGAEPIAAGLAVVGVGAIGIGYATR